MISQRVPVPAPAKRALGKGGGRGVKEWAGGVDAGREERVLGAGGGCRCGVRVE